MTVQMLVGLLETDKRLEERNRSVHVQVIAFTDEARVLDGLDLEDKVTGQVVGMLPRLALESLAALIVRKMHSDEYEDMPYDVLTITHALLDYNSDGVLTTFNLMSLAHWACAFHDLTLTTTLVATA